jgi:alanine racemase
MNDSMGRPADGRSLSWVEISRDALVHNLGQFVSLSGDRKILVVVKSNAYGHGIIESSRIALSAGAAWLGVNSGEEGLLLRRAGITAPVLIMGYVPLALLPEILEADLSLGAVNPETLEGLEKILENSGGRARVHLELETGLNRMGVAGADLPGVLEKVRLSGGRLVVEGVYTHFANIEDTTQHEFAMEQLGRFREMCACVESALPSPILRHTACTAAAILFPDTYFDLLRIGIGAYGMWPSKETLITALQGQKKLLDLLPVMTWKTRVAQVKSVVPGESVGYGRSYRVTRPSRIAVIPVGYAEGYDRSLSNRGAVLIRGEEAPVVGRICMNMFMVDVTHIPETALEDEVVLLGRQGKRRITAEILAELAGTINYEISSRVNPALPRVVV